MEFSALNVDFSSPSLDPPRFKMVSARGRQRGVPPNIVILICIAVGSSSACR